MEGWEIWKEGESYEEMEVRRDSRREVQGRTWRKDGMEGEREDLQGNIKVYSCYS